MISNGLSFGAAQPMLLLRRLIQKKIERTSAFEESAAVSRKAVGDTAAQMIANRLKLRQTKATVPTQREMESAVEKSLRRFDGDFDLY